MPRRNSQSHLLQAERSEAFLKLLPEDQPYREWVIVVLFYCALHYVEAFLVTKNGDYRNHDFRRNEMKRHAETSAILVAYHQLQKAADEARYEGTEFRQADIDGYQPLFEQVKSAMRRAVQA